MSTVFQKVDEYVKDPFSGRKKKQFVEMRNI